MKNESIELVFHVWKTSPLNSFSYQILSKLLGLCLHLIRSCVAWSFIVFVVKKSIQGKRVHWTRFLIRSCSAGCLIRSGCVCTWSNRVSNGALDQIMFAVKKKYTRKTSSTNSFSLYGRRVQWTRFSLYTFSTQILVK